MKVSDIDFSIEPQSDIWLQERLGVLTSSKIHTLFVSGKPDTYGFGTGAITYLDEKIAEILSGETKESPDTEAIMHGLAEEPFAKERYSSIVNREVGKSFWIKYNSIFGGTNDGYVAERNKIKSCLEIKCPDTKKHVKVLKCEVAQNLEKIDPQYWHQVQANTLFCGADYGDFVSFDPRIKHYDFQIKIIRIFPATDWRKSLDDIVGRAADYMGNAIEIIKRVPELNMGFREANFAENIVKLQDAIEGLNEIKI